MTRKLTGRSVLAIFIVSFALIIAVNFGMAWLAVTTFPGEVQHGKPPGGLKMIQK